MGQLMHHDHLHGPEAQPVARGRGFEHELDDLAVVEVAADELAVGLVFLEAGDGEVGGGHDGLADGGDAGEEVLREGGGGAREGLDEDYQVVGVGLVGVEALDAEGHGYDMGKIG